MNDSPEAGAAGQAARAEAETARDASSPAAAASRPSSAGPVSTASGQQRTVLIGIAAVLLIAITAVWFGNQRLARAERDFARRLQSVELAAAQRQEQARLLADTLREAQGRLALMEARLAESLGQQLQLRQLYDEMARNRGDLLLADVENSILIAEQQLQLGGNVQGALLALQHADQVLGRASLPSAIALRRTVAQDIERLKAVPQADFTAAVARLDAVIGSIEQMPALADLEPARPPASETPRQPSARPQSPMPSAEDAPPGPPDAPGDWQELAQRVWRTVRQGWEVFLAELRGLLRVQRVDRPDALLLSPDQRFFARENLRLQLLHARMNLLSRNEALFRADVSRSLQSIERWFDPRHRAVAGNIATLRQLQATELASDLPSLADSLSAIRAARAASEAR